MKMKNECIPAGKNAARTPGFGSLPYRAVIVFLIFTILVFTGCSAKSNESWVTTDSVANSSTAPSYGYFNKESSSWMEDAKTEAPESNSPQESANSSTSSNGSAATNRKLIKTVDLRVETLNFEESCAAITANVEAMGGYIENSSTSDYTFYGSRNNRYASYTIRIPGEHLTAFVNAMGTIGNVTSQDMSTVDVTMSYLDVESRAKALEIQQERLLALLEKADTIEDIIALEERLSEVTYELEAKESVLKNYDNLVTYSTVSIYLNEVSRVTVAEPETVGERISSGLSETFYNLGEGIKNFFVWFIVSLPYLVLWGVIIAVVILIIIKLTRKSGKRKHNRKELSQNAPTDRTAVADSNDSEGKSSNN